MFRFAVWAACVAAIRVPDSWIGRNNSLRTSHAFKGQGVLRCMLRCSPSGHGALGSNLYFFTRYCSASRNEVLRNIRAGVRVHTHTFEQIFDDGFL